MGLARLKRGKKEMRIAGESFILVVILSPEFSRGSLQANEP